MNQNHNELIEQINSLKDQLKKKTFDLEERKKELNCLYTISKIAETENLDIDSLMQQVVDIIPLSFQYPDIVIAKAVVLDKPYENRPHAPSQWKIFVPIVSSGKKKGWLTVYLTQEPDPNLQKRFFKEKQGLINAVCQRIGEIIECIQTNEQLKEVKAGYYRDITQKKEKEYQLNQGKERLQQQNIRLRSTIKDRYRFQNIIGMSSAMQNVYDQILTAANSDANVSIYGESGTGKELVARAIHDMSPRNADTFVTINCGAIPEPLMESEFFGYKKGAFTGAAFDKHGYLDLADTGTLFLDEIGDLPLSMQVKLLRAIDGGGYYPIGSESKHTSDFRIVAATNKNLKQLVGEGFMREDFYYRIQVIPIFLPPLKDRKEDISLLVDHFTDIYAQNSPFKKIPNHIAAQICNYDWPGNIRELQNVLLRFFSTGEFEISNMIVNPGKSADVNRSVPIGDSSNNLSHTIEMVEKEQIINALQSTNWHRSCAAERLGISRSTLFRRMKKHGLILTQNV